MLNPATVEGKGTHLTVSHGTDTDLLVSFYFNKVHEKDFVRIRVPGDSKTEWDEPVQQKHKDRFPVQWDAYQRKVSQHGDDTLLEDADFISENMKEHYRRNNIETVKQLANIPDAFLQALGPGARENQKKALAFIRAEAEMVDAKKIDEENRHLHNKIVDQALKIEELTKMVQELANQKPAPKKPGPKKKAKKVANERTDDSSTSES